MVGMRWNDWNRMPTRSRRKSAKPSSSSPPRSMPSTTTRPAGRPLDAADDREQAGLAGARRAHHAHSSSRPRRGGRRRAGWSRHLPNSEGSDGRRKARSSGGTRSTQRQVRQTRWSAGRRRSKAAVLAVACWCLAACPGRRVQARRARRFADRRLRGRRAGEAFPARLELALAKLGAPCEVLDAGVSGDTSAGGAARIDWVLGDRPTHLLVELGGNDALRALPVGQLRGNLEQIIRTAKAREVPVYAGRDAGTAQSRPRLWRSLQGGLLGSRRRIRAFRSIPSSWMERYWRTD